MNLSMHCYLILLLSFGNLAQSTSVIVSQAQAKESEDAEMRMTFTPTSGESLVFLSWFKSDEAGIPVGVNILTNVTGSPVGGDRYSLSGDGSLIIHNVSRYDDDYYMCRVFTSAATNIQGFSKLTVNYLDPPSLPEDSTFCEDLNVNFSCSFPDGFPTPITLTWIKNGVVLDVSDIMKYPQSNTTLEIKDVVISDKGYYECRAENAVFSGNEGKRSENTGNISFKSCSVVPGIILIVIGCISVLLGISYLIYIYCGCFSNLHEKYRSDGCCSTYGHWIAIAAVVIGLILIIVGICISTLHCEC